MELVLLQYFKTHPELLLVFMAGGFWFQHARAKKNGQAPLTREDLRTELTPLVNTMQEVARQNREQNSYLRGFLERGRGGL